MTKSVRRQDRERIKMIEDGFLITFKDNSCSFIRKKELKKESGYFFNEVKG